MPKLGIALFALLLVAGLSWQHEGVPVRTDRAPASVATSFPLLRLVSDHRYRYQFEREIEIQWSGTSEHSSFSGDFVIDVLSKDQQMYRVRATLLVKNVKSERDSSLEALIDERGRVHSLFRPTHSTEAFSDGLIKDVFSHWAFFESKDTSGSYDADFEQATSTTWRKKKRVYARKDYQVLSSEHTSMWKEGVPVLLEGEDQTSGLDAFFATLKVSLRLESKTAMSFLPIREWQAVGFELESESPNLEASAKMPFYEVERILSHPWSSNSFGRVIKFIKANPAKISELVAKVRGASAAGALFKQTVGALASAGTPEAQEALREIFEDQKKNVAGQQTILTAVNLMTAPLTVESAEWLKNTFLANHQAEIANGALYALGSSLDHTPSLATKTLLIEAWNAAQSPQEKKVALDAMGNSAQPEWLPIFEGAFKDSDRSVRVASIQSLRNFPAPLSSELMGRALNDADPEVRKTAASVTEYQNLAAEN